MSFDMIFNILILTCLAVYVVCSEWFIGLMNKLAWQLHRIKWLRAK